MAEPAPHHEPAVTADDERTEAVSIPQPTAPQPLPIHDVPPGSGAHPAGPAATGSTALVDDEAARPHRRGPDPLALVVGLATLAMAVFAFTGELPDLGFVDPRWLLASGAAVVGLLLLVGNLRRAGGRRDGG